MNRFHNKVALSLVWIKKIMINHTWSLKSSINLIDDRFGIVTSETPDHIHRPLISNLYFRVTKKLILFSTYRISPHELIIDQVNRSTIEVTLLSYRAPLIFLKKVSTWHRELRESRDALRHSCPTRFASSESVTFCHGEQRAPSRRSPASDFDRPLRACASPDVTNRRRVQGSRRNVTRTTGRMPAALTEHVLAMTKSVEPFLSVLGMRHPPIRLYAAAPVALHNRPSLW